MSATISLSRVHFPVTALGPGRRLGVWVQGCPLACPGCLARDTWDPAGGTTTPVEEVVDAWRAAHRQGATGLTVSGGEPSGQAGAVAALIDGVRATEGGDDADVLVYSGLDLDELTAAASGIVERADAVITGRFVITKPTDLVWRGSANQALVPLTDLGRRRFAAHVTERSDTPAMQYVVEDDRIWFVGVPRVGELRRLERSLGEHGLSFEGASWRR